MNHALLPMRSRTRSSRRSEIQSHWSDGERRARAAAGRRRLRQLADLLFGDTEQEPELWAVGAPTRDDLPRLAG
jgi:hypothetical protein